MKYKIGGYPVGYSKSVQFLEHEARLQCGQLHKVYTFTDTFDFPKGKSKFAVISIRRHKREYYCHITKYMAVKES